MRFALPAILALAVIACSSGQPSTFAVTGASVDPTYRCPAASNNAPYALHATVDVRNGTKSAVTIRSVTAQMTLVATHGPWLEKPGDRYDAGAATFSPATVSAGSTASVDVTINSACTSDKPASGTSSSGDYSVTVKMVTSTGTYTVTAKNQHQILAG